MTLIRHSFVYSDLMSTIQHFGVFFYITDLKSSSIRSGAIYFNWYNCALTTVGLIRRPLGRMAKCCKCVPLV